MKAQKVKRVYQTCYKISSTKTVAFDRVFDYGDFPPVAPKHIQDRLPRQAINYSAAAAKRFKSALDNMVCMMKAAEHFNPDYLFYNFHGKVHKRKPVFLTLTLPKQEVDDYDVKRKLLDNLLQNLKKTWALQNYIWKAEAQERGAIHFHLVVDAFIPEFKVRQLWFQGLKRLGCISQYATLRKSSRLVHFKLIENLDTAVEEIGGYFDGVHDETGKLIHKHDRERRVRDITGRSWGCSDSLRYKQMTIFDLIPEVEHDMRANALQTFPIKSKTDQVIAEVRIRKKIIYNRNTRKYHVIHAKDRMEKYLLYYHLDQAEKCYAGTTPNVPRALFGETKGLWKHWDENFSITKTETLSAMTAFAPQDTLKQTKLW